VYDAAVADFVNSPKNPPPRSAFDRLLRRFARVSYHVFVALLLLIAASALGVALAPAVWVWRLAATWASGMNALFTYLVCGLGLSAAFFTFGFALLLVVPVYNFVLPTRVKPFKGGYYTIHAMPWVLHNVLFYLVRYTFLPFVTLTPFGVAFLKAMGMTIGRHSFINTEFISDPRLIVLGDDVTLGGSVRLFAHYGGGGNLVIAPVIIEDRATVGVGATIMGDVRIGKGAVILPHSALLPGSRVGEGETWGGIPARPIPREEMDKLKASIR
jgi:acetyltransferase-like isoleucine patch superfamily enzyme